MSTISVNAYSPTKYRPIYINNIGGPELTYYQIPLNVTYDSDMQTDFDDLRVKYYNGSEWVSIPYWIEEKVDGSWCKLWFNATSVPPDSWCNSSYELYYGDNTTTSESDFNSTIFNNFWEPDSDNDAPLPEWNPYNVKIEGHDEWGVSGVRIHGNILKFNYSNEQSKITIDFDIKWTEFAFHADALEGRNSFFKVYNSNNKFIFELFRAGTDKDLYEYAGSGNFMDVRQHSHKIADISTGTQYNIKITYNESGTNEWKVYFNGVYKVTVDRGDYKNDPAKKVILRGGMSGNIKGDNTFFIYFNNDAFYQRTYSSPRPTTKLGAPGKIEPLYISTEEVGEGYVKINASWSGFIPFETGHYFVFCGMSYGDIKSKKADGNGILTVQETLHGLFIEGKEYCCRAAVYRGNSSTDSVYTDEACFVATSNKTLKQTSYGNYMDNLIDISSESNVTTWASALSEPYKDRMGMTFFGIIFVLPFIAMWIRGSNTIIPSILGMILGGFIWAYMPEKFVHMAYLFIIISIAGVVYGIFRQKV